MVTITSHGKLLGITDEKSPSIIIIINEQKLDQGDYFNQVALKGPLTYNEPDVGTLCLQRVCLA